MTMPLRLLIFAAVSLCTIAMLDRVVIPGILDADTWQTWSLVHAGLYAIGAIISTFLLHKYAMLRVHGAWIAFCATVVSGWLITRVDLVALVSADGVTAASRIFQALVTPEFDILGDALVAMVETIYLAFMATAIALPFSFVLSFVSARNLMTGSVVGNVVYVVMRFLANFTRSIEPLIWAIIFSVWVGIGPFAGMLALAIHTVSSLTKQYSEQIESVDQGPMEAIEATGATRIQTIWFAIVPQCVLPFLSFTIYRWDINVRMATVIGLVGGGGIGTMLIQYQGLAQWHEVGTIVILIALVVWIMDVISARVRAALT